MRLGGRAAASGVYLSTALLATVVLLLGSVLSETLIISFLFLFLTLSATCVLAGLALVDFPLAAVAAPPGSTLAYLGSRLRYTQTRVAEGAGEIRVQVGSTSVARVRVRQADAGSRITFRLDFTPTGLGIVLILLVFGLAPVAIPVIVAAFAAVRRFALRQVAPLLPAAGPLPPPARQDEVQDLLVSGLAEGHRLAAEAYEAERSSYHDAQGIAALGALFVWAGVLIASFTGSGDPDPAARIRTAAEFSIAAAVAFEILAGLLVRRRFAPRLRRVRTQAEDLRKAWLREVSRVSSDVAGPSSFELLAEASKEVPGWLHAVRRSGLSRDPAIGLFLVTVALWALGLFPGAIVAAVAGNVALAVILGLGGVGLTAAFLWLYRRLKERWRVAFTEELSRWNRRFEDLRSRMDRFLEDL